MRLRRRSVRLLSVVTRVVTGFFVHLHLIGLKVVKFLLDPRLFSVNDGDSQCSCNPSLKRSCITRVNKKQPLLFFMVGFSTTRQLLP